MVSLDDRRQRRGGGSEGSSSSSSTSSSSTRRMQVLIDTVRQVCAGGAGATGRGRAPTMEELETVHAVWTEFAPQVQRDRGQLLFMLQSDVFAPELLTLIHIDALVFLGELTAATTSTANDVAAAAAQFVARMNHFLLADFDLTQFHRAHGNFSAALLVYRDMLTPDHFAQAYVALEHAVTRVQTHHRTLATQLAPLHAVFVQVAVWARQQTRAVPLLDTHFPRVTSVAAPAMRTTVPFLLYGYFSGLLYAHQRRWAEAQQAFRLPLWVSSTALSAIQIASYRHLLVTYMIAHSESLNFATCPNIATTVLPPGVPTHGAWFDALQTESATYVELCKAYADASLPRFTTIVERAQVELQRHHMLGLVLLASKSLSRILLRRLTGTYVRLSVTDVTSMLGIERATLLALLNEEIAAGRVNGLIDAQHDMVRFDWDDDGDADGSSGGAVGGGADGDADDARARAQAKVARAAVLQRVEKARAEQLAHLVLDVQHMHDALAARSASARLEKPFVTAVVEVLKDGRGGGGGGGGGGEFGGAWRPKGSRGHHGRPALAGNDSDTDDDGDFDGLGGGGGGGGPDPMDTPYDADDASLRAALAQSISDY